MQNIRTFVAIEIDEEIRHALGRVTARLGRSGANVNWVSQDMMHLTLSFLGDVEATRTSDVCQAVARAGRTAEPFAFELRGLGAFPNIDRAKVLWVGVGEGAQRVEQLQEAVAEELDQIGFPPEARRFHAHVTLGRVRRDGATAPLQAALREKPDEEFGLQMVDEVVVFSSIRGADGHRYAPLGHLKLSGDA